MSSEPYIVETAVLLLLAFVLGGLVGFYARRWFSPRPLGGSAEEVRPTSTQAVNSSSAVDDSGPRRSRDSVQGETPDERGKPLLLPSARDGMADDLKKIKGVGPKLETVLHDLGIYHYDQIAAWDAEAIAWVDDKLSFHGRVEREDWVAQAKALADEPKSSGA